MLRLLSALLFVALSVAPARAQQWVEYKDATAGYRVEFPQAPKVQTQPVQTTAGTRQMGIATFDRERDGVSISYMTVFPERPATWNGDPQVTLDRVRDNAVRAANGKLREEKRLTGGNGEPARRFVIADMPKGQVGVVLQVMKGDQLYQAIAVVSAGQEDSADTQRFINSFALLPR
jgi:hypothetical protein